MFHWTVKRPEPAIKATEPVETQSKTPTSLPNQFNTESPSDLLKKFRNYEI